MTAILHGDVFQPRNDEPRIAIEGEVGSVAFGVSTPESDHDLIRVVVEPLDALLGVDYLEPLSKIRSVPENAQMDPGGTEITVLYLQDLMKRALAMQHSVMPLFYTPILTRPDRLGIREIADAFISQRVVTSHGNYAANLIRQLNGEIPPATKRPELVARHGYDTKMAYTLFSLLRQALSLSFHRHLQMPFATHIADEIMEIRAGAIPVEAVIERARRQINLLESVKNSLPEQPDHARVNAFLKTVYLEGSQS